MATSTQIGDYTIFGNLNVSGLITGPTSRDNLLTEEDQLTLISPHEWRVWDAMQTNLGTGASDDLGIGTGVFGTNVPYLSSGDLNAAGAVTRYARAFKGLPSQYVENQSFRVYVNAGMLNAVASVSATVDLEIYYKSGDGIAVTGGDLVTTSAQNINSLTFGTFTFNVTGTALTVDSRLDVRITIAANSATASSHFAAISFVRFGFPLKG